ncbi:MAG: metal ABC transporter ATP-binding protein [Dehalococcoidia bacterium]|nr:metal ABC transporter ATP-binding protein [Dehalococcoidia bacterium]
MANAIRTGSGVQESQSDTIAAQAYDLSVGYPNDTVASGINFALPIGQAMALIGTNGSGKSTILKTMVGLLAPRSGKLTVFGGRPTASASRIAYLGQFHNAGFILPLRAVDVVSMGRFPLHGLTGKMDSRDFDICMEALRTMGAEKLADIPLRSLSGGQQQRVYLAQVLAHRADLLVMDEPTSGLDAGGRELYLQAMNSELRRGASLLVATHDIREEARLCQQVMLLARRVVAFGPPEAVLNTETLLETFGIVIGGDTGAAVPECRHSHTEGEPAAAVHKRKLFRIR